MNRQIIALIILLTLFIIWLEPLNFGPIKVNIAEGVNGTEIAKILSQKGVLRDIPEFLFFLKILGKERSLKSGTYELYRYKNPIYLINKLTQGRGVDIRITIPEGFTIFEIADVLEKNGLVDKTAFISLCCNQKFIRSLGLKGKTLEGYFFPDTYLFNENQSDTEIIQVLVDNFKKHTNNFNITDQDSLYKILTLASIVEKEAKYEDERPIIARVFLNRIKKRRPLESCATVLYAMKLRNMEIPHRRLTEKQLLIKSPYNTYQNLGLPPGPICSPGMASLKAVISPARVDYLYFVSMGNGRHHFSRTYQEHLAAKEHYNAKK